MEIKSTYVKPFRIPKRLCGLFFAVGVVVTIAVVLIHLSLQDRENYRWVNRDYGVQSRLQEVLLAMEAAEDAQEAYLQGHDRVALDACDAALLRASNSLHALEPLLVADAQQMAQLEVLRHDLSAHRQSLRNLSAARTSPPRSSGEVKQLLGLGTMHRSIERMKQVEAERLSRHIFASFASQRRIDTAFLCFLVVVALLLVALYWALRRALHRERQAEQMRRARDKQDLLREAAQQRNQELQNLARRMVEIQEAERGHLAYELHEEIGQVLTGLKLALGGIRKQGGVVRDLQIDTAQEQITELMRQIRALSLDLRPGVLDDFGLKAALEWYCTHYAEQTEIMAVLTMIGLDERLDGAVETTAYRIVQEVLAAVAHYVGIVRVEVEVEHKDPSLTIQLRSYTTGNPLRQAQKFCDATVLLGIQERANLIGGSLEVTPAAEEGVTVVACLPVQPVYTSLEA